MESFECSNNGTTVKVTVSFENNEAIIHLQSALLSHWKTILNTGGFSNLHDVAEYLTNFYESIQKHKGQATLATPIARQEHEKKNQQVTVEKSERYIACDSHSRTDSEFILREHGNDAAVHCMSVDEAAAEGQVTLQGVKEENVRTCFIVTDGGTFGDADGGEQLYTIVMPHQPDDDLEANTETGNPAELQEVPVVMSQDPPDAMDTDQTAASVISMKRETCDASSIHVKSDDYGDDDSDIGQNSEQSSIIYTCPYCDVQMAGKIRFETHLHGHLTLAPKCETCGANFENGEELMIHRTLKHLNEKLKCTYCDYRYTNLQTYRLHLDKHKEKYKFLCDYCLRGFQYKNQYVHHMNRHKEVRPYKCGKCHKGFYGNSDRRKHEHTCGVSGQFHCNTCDKYFKTARYLQLHQAIHLQKAEYVCVCCSKSYALQSSLIKHEKKCIELHNLASVMEPT